MKAAITNHCKIFNVLTNLSDNSSMNSRSLSLSLLDMVAGGKRKHSKICSVIAVALRRSPKYREIIVRQITEDQKYRLKISSPQKVANNGRKVTLRYRKKCVERCLTACLFTPESTSCSMSGRTAIHYTTFFFKSLECFELSKPRCCLECVEFE